MQNNQYYFKISQQNPEELLDKFYVFDSKHPDLKKYISNTKEIKNILITIKTLQSRKEKTKTVDKYFCELQKVLCNVSNCSEFICFVNACDNTLNSVKQDLDLIKKITKKYFEKRILNEVVPEEWIQAVLDSNSSRKKRQVWRNKITLNFAKTWFQ